VAEKPEGAALDPAQRKLLKMRCVISDWRASICGRTKNPLSRWRSAWRIWHEVFRKRARCRPSLCSAASPTARNSRVCPSNAVDRAAVDAREVVKQAGCSKLDQPTYMTIMASAENQQLRRDF